MIAIIHRSAHLTTELASQFRDSIIIRDPFTRGPLPRAPFEQLIKTRSDYYEQSHKHLWTWYNPSKQAKKFSFKNKVSIGGLRTIEEAAQAIRREKDGVVFLSHLDFLTDLIALAAVTNWLNEIETTHDTHIPAQVIVMECFNPKGEPITLTTAHRQFLLNFWRHYISGKPSKVLELLNKTKVELWDLNKIRTSYEMIMPRTSPPRLSRLDHKLLSSFRVRTWRPAIEAAKNAMDVIDLIGDTGLLWRLQEWNELNKGRYLQYRLIPPGDIPFRYIELRLTSEGRRLLTTGLTPDDNLSALKPLMGLTYHSKSPP